MSTQPIDAAALWADLLAVRQQSPLVHSITNFVVMNYNANALLAVGASPVMAHAKEEVKDMVGIAQALVLNIGTLEPDWIESMRLALQAARARGVPVVLDPVGGELAESALRSLGWRGRYLVVGFAEGTIPRLPLNLALLSEREILGVYVGEYFRREPAARAGLSAEILGMAAQGKFAPPISAEYELSDFAEAFKALRDRRAVGKIVLRS